MTLQDFLAVLGDNKEALEFFSTSQAMTIEGFKKFAEENSEAKQYIQSQADSRVTKGIESWKQDNIPTITEELRKELNPEESEEAKAMRELRDRLGKIEAENKRLQINSFTIKALSEAGLPSDFADYVQADTVEGTTAKIGNFVQLYSKNQKSKLDETLQKEYGRSVTDPQQLSKETANPYGINPFSNDYIQKNPNTYFDQQLKIQRENPDLASRLRGK